MRRLIGLRNGRYTNLRHAIEFTLKDGKRQYARERLRKARRALSKLVRSGELFTFVEMAEERGGAWDSTNSMIEGGVSARLREMLRAHRGSRRPGASRRSSGGATCTPRRRWRRPRYCASCRPTTKWTGCSRRLPASAGGTTGRPRSTGRASIGASSTCSRGTDGEQA